jgi:ASCH domain
MRGLAAPTCHAILLKEKWAKLIADGEKTWEVRGRPETRRGRVALIAAGTGGFIIGGATLVECLGPLTRDELSANTAKHCADSEEDHLSLSLYKR